MLITRIKKIEKLTFINSDMLILPTAVISIITVKCHYLMNVKIKVVFYIRLQPVKKKYDKFSLRYNPCNKLRGAPESYNFGYNFFYNRNKQL